MTARSLVVLLALLSATALAGSSNKCSDFKCPEGMVKLETAGDTDGNSADKCCKPAKTTCAAFDCAAKQKVQVKNAKKVFAEDEATCCRAMPGVCAGYGGCDPHTEELVENAEEVMQGDAPKKKCCRPKPKKYCLALEKKCQEKQLVLVGKAGSTEQGPSPIETCCVTKTEKEEAAEGSGKKQSTCLAFDCAAYAKEAQVEGGLERIATAGLTALPGPSCCGNEFADPKKVEARRAEVCCNPAKACCATYDCASKNGKVRNVKMLKVTGDAVDEATCCVAPQMSCAQYAECNAAGKRQIRNASEKFQGENPVGNCCESLPAPTTCDKFDKDEPKNSCKAHKMVLVENPELVVGSSLTDCCVMTEAQAAAKAKAAAEYMLSNPAKDVFGVAGAKAGDKAVPDGDAAKPADGAAADPEGPPNADIEGSVAAQKAGIRADGKTCTTHGVCEFVKRKLLLIGGRPRNGGGNPLEQPTLRGTASYYREVDAVTKDLEESGKGKVPGKEALKGGKPIATFDCGIYAGKSSPGGRSCKSVCMSVLDRIAKAKAYWPSMPCPVSAFDKEPKAGDSNAQGSAGAPKAQAGGSSTASTSGAAASGSSGASGAAANPKPKTLTTDNRRRR